MKIGLKQRDRLGGSSDTGRLMVDEVDSIVGELSAWTNTEHDDDGKHTNVTAKTISLAATVRQAAMKIVSGWMEVGSAAVFSGAITPDELTADVLNYAPIGIDRAFMVRLSATVPVAIGGIQDGFERPFPLNGRVLALFNAGSQDITLTHEETASWQYFRFRLPGFFDMVIPPNNFAFLYYDAYSRRWVMLSNSSGTSGTASSEYNAGNSGAAITIDWANGTQQILTLTDNAAISFANGVEGQEYRLIMVEGGAGGFEPTFVSPTVVFENTDLTPAAIAAGEVLQAEFYYTLLNGGQYFGSYQVWELELNIDAGDLSLSDDTTNNVTSSAHGFAPKSPGDPETFLNGDTTPDYTVPRRELQYSDGSVPGGNTVANTGTETAFASTYTIPADDLAVGDVLRIRARGTLGTDGAAAPTLRLKFYAGATAWFDTTAITLPVAATSWGWIAEIDVIVTSLGVTGSVEAQGQVVLPLTAATATIAAVVNTSAITLDTTATAVLTLKVTWGTADTDNTITLRTFSVERLRTA